MSKQGIDVYQLLLSLILLTEQMYEKVQFSRLFPLISDCQFFVIFAF